MLSGPSGHWILHKCVDSFFAALLGADTSLRCESEQAGGYCIVPRWRHSNIVLDSTLCWLQKGQVQSNFRLCKAEIRRRCTWKNLVRRPWRRAEGQSMQSVAQWLTYSLQVKIFWAHCTGTAGSPLPHQQSLPWKSETLLYCAGWQQVWIRGALETQLWLLLHVAPVSSLFLVSQNVKTRGEVGEVAWSHSNSSPYRWRWGNCGWQVHRQPWETQMGQVTIWLQFPDLDMQRLEINPHRIVLSYCA